MPDEKHYARARRHGSWKQGSRVRVKQYRRLRAVVCDAAQDRQLVVVELCIEDSEGEGDGGSSCWRNDSSHVFVVSVIQPADGTSRAGPHGWRKDFADRH